MPGHLRDAKGRINPDAELLSYESLAVLHARDGDTAPLIKRLRDMAARLRTGASLPAYSQNEIDCAADLLEAARQPLSPGKPRALSTWWRDLLITKSHAAWSQNPGTWKQGRLTKALAKHFNVSRDYVRKLLRRGVPKGWRGQKRD